MDAENTGLSEARREAPDLEEVYRDHLGLFYDALSRLAKQGFACPLDAAPDLIHDFFADAWEGLVDRFDPEKGEFWTYLYTAFSWFARRRIARMDRYQRPLQDLDDWLGSAHLPAIEADPSANVDSKTVGKALARLLEDERELLTGFFGTRSSERRFARTLGISRYGLRTRLLDALGRLASELRVESEISEGDSWAVSVQVWKYGASMAEAAERLGLSLEQAKAAHHRNKQMLERGLPTTRPADRG